MAKSLDKANAKWKDKTKAASGKWKKGKDKAISDEEYSKGLAAVEGMPSESTIKDSTPNKNWKEQLGKATESDFESGVTKAADRDKWKGKFKAAFEK